MSPYVIQNKGLRWHPPAFYVLCNLFLVYKNSAKNLFVNHYLYKQSGSLYNYA